MSVCEWDANETYFKNYCKMINLPFIGETRRISLSYTLGVASGVLEHHMLPLNQTQTHLALQHRHEALSPPLRATRCHIVIETRVLERELRCPLSVALEEPFRSDLRLSHREDRG